MKKISVWGRANPWKARSIIVFLHLVLWICGWTIGKQLAAFEVFLSSASWWLLLLAFYTALILYPHRHLRASLGSAKFYLRQKGADLGLLLAGLGMIIFLANRPAALFNEVSSFAAERSLPVLPVDSGTKSYKTPLAFAASMRDENGKKLQRWERRKLLKAQVRAIKADPTISKGERTALIILSVILALIAIMGVASLACNLSCSGSDAAALVVGVGGTALVIFLLVKVIRSINRKAGRLQPPEGDAVPVN